MGRARQESGPTSLSTRSTPFSGLASEEHAAGAPLTGGPLSESAAPCTSSWASPSWGWPTAVPRRPASGTCEEHRTCLPCARAPSGSEARELAHPARMHHQRAAREPLLTVHHACAPRAMSVHANGAAVRMPLSGGGASATRACQERPCPPLLALAWSACQQPWFSPPQLSFFLF